MKVPQVLRLESHPAVTVTEQRGWWTKGKIDDRNFELSFEDYVQFLPYAAKMFPIPRVPLTYLGIFSKKHTVVEFQLGQWPQRPRDEEAHLQLSILLSLLMDVRPMFYQPSPTPIQIAQMAAHAYPGTRVRSF